MTDALFFAGGLAAAFAAVGLMTVALEGYIFRRLVRQAALRQALEHYERARPLLEENLRNQVEAELRAEVKHELERIEVARLNAVFERERDAAFEARPPCAI